MDSRLHSVEPQDATALPECVRTDSRGPWWARKLRRCTERLILLRKEDKGSQQVGGHRRRLTVSHISPRASEVPWVWGAHSEEKTSQTKGNNVQEWRVLQRSLPGKTKTSKSSQAPGCASLWLPTQGAQPECILAGTSSSCLH